MLLQQMDDRVQVQRAWFKNYKFHLVQGVDQLGKLVDLCISRGRYSIDCETTGVDNRIYKDSYFEDGIVTKHGIRTVDKVVGLCISFDGLNGYYVPLSHEPEDSGNLPWEESWDVLTRLVHSGSKAIFHNAKFDAEFLYPLTGKAEWARGEFEDIFLMAKVVNPLKGVPAGLKALTKLHFDIDMVELDELFTEEKKEQLKREKRKYNFGLLHPKEGLEYGSSDGIFTFKLEPILREKLQGQDNAIYNLEKAFCNVVRKMERNRVHIDVARVEQLNTECNAAILEVGDLIRNSIEGKTGKTGKWLTLNIGSPAQLSRVLITDPEGLKLKPTSEMVGSAETGWTTEDSDDDDDDDDGNGEVQYSLKDEAIKSLHRAYGSKYLVQRLHVFDKDGKPKQESIFELILEYRHYDKMRGSYVEKLQKAHDRLGDVRPAFNQMGTDTARLSAKAGKIDEGYSGVNFMGIPRDSDEDKPELFKQIRTCIIPRPGKVLVKLDYSGEELRVVTNLSGDPIWTKSFLYEDGDVHSITARTLFGKTEVNKDERNRGKRCNFAFIYGGGAGAIQRNVGCSIEDAQRHMSNLKDAVPTLMGYVEGQKQFARKHKCIFTAFGRRIPIPTIDSPIRGIKAKAERCAINYTIQSTSADILKYALCYVDKMISEKGWDDVVKYVLTVHDEVVYEVEPEMLMEVVRALDLWMTTPWTLPKAHGRDWVVPLLTEPGIDINWKARYDFFAMVDGTPVKPSEIGPEGEYKGKLKKDQYYLDGRVYQKIPDFLKDHIHRMNELPASEKKPELPASTEPVQAEAPLPLLPPQVETPIIEGPAALPALPAPVPTPTPIPAPTPTPIPKPEPVKEKEPVLDSNEFDIDVGMGEFSGASKEPSVPKPAPASPTANGAATNGKSNGTSHSNGIPEGRRPPTSEDEKVFRWIFRAKMTLRNQRKFRAALILGEGDILLRVLDSRGNIMIPDNEGLRINPDEFRHWVEQFGLDEDSDH